MRTNYRIGYELEQRAKKTFEKAGWIVQRSAGSKGAFDLVAFNDNAKFLVQCKKTHSEELRVSKLTELMLMSKRVNAKPLLVYGFFKSPVYVTEIEGDKEVLSTTGVHKELEKFLAVDQLQDQADYIAR